VDVLRFFALLAGRDVEFDALTLVEGLVAVAFDIGKMHEDVIALFARNESKPFVGIEELHGALRHKYSILRAADQRLRPTRSIDSSHALRTATVQTAQADN
jgi:hypothetical protein